MQSDRTQSAAPFQSCPQTDPALPCDGIPDTLSEAKPAEQGLRESDVTRAYVMSSARCVLWYADVEDIGHPDLLRWETHVVDEEAAQQFLSVEVQPGEAYQEALYRAKLPNDRNACDRLALASIRAGKSYTQEFRIQAADGTIRWLHEDIQVETVVEGKQWRLVGVCTDITEHKRTEQTLRESETLYRTLGEAVPDFIWTYSPDASGNYVNRRWTEYTGLTLEQAYLVPMDYVHHPEDLPQLSERWTEALRRGESYEAESRLRRHDGVYRWFVHRAVPVKDEQGRIVRWIGTTTDIHERKLAEEALRRSEAHYRQLVEAMPQLAWITDADGIPEYFNQRWCDYTGMSLQEMQDSSRPPVTHPNDRERAVAGWKQAVRTGQPYEMEYRLRRVDGTYRWFLARGIPLKDEQGQITRWFGTCTDIEDQKRTEEKEHFLAEASAVLASSLDYETTLANVAKLAVPHLADWCAVHVVEAEGTVRPLAVAHINPDKVRWAQELQSRYPYDPNASRGFAEVLRTGQPIFYPKITDAMLVAAARDEEHLRIMREVGFTSAMIVPMKVQERILGALTFVSAETGRPYTQADLTVAEDLVLRAALAVDNARSYKAAQEEIARREQTERQLRLHQAEIEDLNRRLRRSMTETHHRVGNNLQVIAALIDMQRMEAADTVPVAELNRLSSQIRALAAVHQVLTRGVKEEESSQRVSARTVLERMLPLLQQMAGQPPRAFVVSEAALTARQGTALALCLQEMYSNALKHGKGEVAVRFAVENRQATLEVVDNGCGFPEEFNPAQAANTGLSLILSLIQTDLGGHVTFSNRPEGGGRVIVQFPLADQADS